MRSDESSNSGKSEMDAMKQLWGTIKVNSSMNLEEDYYSYAFYGYYLDSDEEELSNFEDTQQLQKLKKSAGSKDVIRSSFSVHETDADQIISDFIENYESNSAEKKQE